MGERERETQRPGPLEIVSPKGLRALAREMRQDASRQLARANDLDEAASRLEEVSGS